MARRRRNWLWGLAVLLPLPIAYTLRLSAELPTVTPVVKQSPLTLQEQGGMIRLDGGMTLIGSPRPSPADQRPVHRVLVKPFWIDATHVTNREFQKFVEATNYVTTAERRGWSLVFRPELRKWEQVPQVNWRHPSDPESSLVGKEVYPVVHVSWFDAVEYANWAEKRLPTEVEVEFAARGGLSDAPFPWGRQLTPGGQQQANYWQGKFPEIDLGLDGTLGVCPVRSFTANRYGLYDMAGNVASWCADWYAPDAYGSSHAEKLNGPDQGTERVHRGGSWLSTSDKGGGIRVGDRGHAVPSETSNSLSFRCARDDAASKR